MLPLLLANGGSGYFTADVPFVTSVGRISTIVSQPAGSQWTVTHVANGFVSRWYRVVAHYWEWQGRTIVRLVANDLYHTADDLEVMKTRFVSQLEAILGQGVEA